MSLRPATTVLLLRPAATGFEIFMVQRHRRSGFLPNAWVFPGGRVDDGDGLRGSDRVRGGAHVLDRLGVDAVNARAFCVAGVRETFEEAGIWLGSGELPWELREPMGRGDVDLAAVLDAHDATIDLDTLRPWSWWVTPEQEQKRFDTRFLVAVTDAHGRHDDREVVDSAWIDPKAVVDAGRRSQLEFPMAPPTWWTLVELSRHRDVDSVLADADARTLLPIQPILRFDDTGIHLLLPGHPEHPVGRIAGLPTRVEYEHGTWVAWDGLERFEFPPSP